MKLRSWFTKCGGGSSAKELKESRWFVGPKFLWTYQVPVFETSFSTITETDPEVKKVNSLATTRWFVSFTPIVIRVNEITFLVHKMWRRKSSTILYQPGQRYLVCCTIPNRPDYIEHINACKNDQKKLFSVLNESMRKKTCESLPDHSSKEKFANKFNNFFINKITTIREDLKNENSEYDIPVEPQSAIASCCTETLHRG